MTKSRKLKIGIDNYGLYPLGLNLLETMQWAKNNGAEGVQFSGLMLEKGETVSAEELRDIKKFAVDNSMYVEWGGGQHVPFDTAKWEKKDIFTVNKKAVEEAEILGTRIVRSCSGGLFRWDLKSPATELLLREMALSLREQRQMLRDHNVILAIETHFEFTTFELLKVFEYCEAEPGDYLGICLDTMNLLIMLEDPLLAVERILPWVVSTHIKDGGLSLEREGFRVFPVELGQGVVGLQKIIQLLSKYDNGINLSVEDHGGDFLIPVFDPVFLSKFPDLTVLELSRLVNTAKKAETSGLPHVVKREKWPEICEQRIRNDLHNLENIMG
jgi:sugar phosphate isomerase/epimerase